MVRRPAKEGVTAVAGAAGSAARRQPGASGQNGQLPGQAPPGRGSADAAGPRADAAVTLVADDAAAAGQRVPGQRGAASAGSAPRPDAPRPGGSPGHSAASADDRASGQDGIPAPAEDQSGAGRDGARGRKAAPRAGSSARAGTVVRERAASPRSGAQPADAGAPPTARRPATAEPAWPGRPMTSTWTPRPRSSPRPSLTSLRSPTLRSMSRPIWPTWTWTRTTWSA